MKLAVASSALSKRIVPSDNCCQALRHVHESTEKVNCPPILFVSEPSDWIANWLFRSNCLRILNCLRKIGHLQTRWNNPFHSYWWMEHLKISVKPETEQTKWWPNRVKERASLIKWGCSSSCSHQNAVTGLNQSMQNKQLQMKHCSWWTTGWGWTQWVLSQWFCWRFLPRCAKLSQQTEKMFEQSGVVPKNEVQNIHCKNCGHQWASTILPSWWTSSSRGTFRIGKWWNHEHLGWSNQRSLANAHDQGWQNHWFL